MKKFIYVMLAGVCLSACGGSQQGSRSGGEHEIVADQGYLASPAPQVQASQLKLGAEGGGQAPTGEPIANDDGAAQFIAYTYSFGLTFPQAAVEPTLQAHVAACEAAGPRICIVTNSNVNNQSSAQTNGYLSLRAIPSWIKAFQGGLEEEVAAAKGEITAQNKQSVDLTRQILDTDARLSAKTTLKGRLEDLLATRDGDLGELLQVERELARVTGEIESITSNLKALRLRVSMSEMTVSYSTQRSLVSGGRSNPLAAAFGDFFYNMSAALAGVITFFAVGLPWMLLFGLFLFIWLRAIWPWVRKTRKKT